MFDDAMMILAFISDKLKKMKHLLMNYDFKANSNYQFIYKSFYRRIYQFNGRGRKVLKTSGLCDMFQFDINYTMLYP